MKILLQQFLGQNHSWSVVGQNLARALIHKGNNVDLFSTNGTKYFPEDLKNNLIGYFNEDKKEIIGKYPSDNYDCQISYTAMHNFPKYLSHGNKNRFGIWCYEFAGKNVLPTGFAKNYRNCDFVCPPSEFAKRGFVDSGIPESSIKVIPHGIDISAFSRSNDAARLQNITNKTFKLGAVFAQNHKRKNIPGLLEAYGRAFTNKDDVCLILKAQDKPISQSFEVSLNDCIKRFKEAFPRHGEIRVISDFITDMSIFYRSIDVYFTLAFAEAFNFPVLEAIAAGKSVIAPNSGGQVDFLNETNALLVNGKESRADPTSMYYEQKQSALWFVPSVDDAVGKLKYAHKNYKLMNSLVDKDRDYIHKKYDWNNISDMFLGLCK